MFDKELPLASQQSIVHLSAMAGHYKLLNLLKALNAPMDTCIKGKCVFPRCPGQRAPFFQMRTDF